MAKIYSKNPFKNQNFKPKDETINFLLNYSKALKIVSYKDTKFETVLN